MLTELHVPCHSRRQRSLVARRASRSVAGLTLIELLVAISLLLAGSAVFAHSTLLVRSARMDAQEHQAAVQILREAVDTLTVQGLTLAHLNYAPNANGDPYPAPGSGPGAPFLADGLQRIDDPTLPAQVVVRFFTDETHNEPRFGLPRDLDGDGLATNPDCDVVGDDGLLVARLLPVEVEISWRGRGRFTRTLNWQSILTRN